MKNRLFKYIFSLLLFSVLLMVGCGSGGGQSVLQQESPEDAVMRISNNWRASTDSPAVVVDANNRFIRQATDQESNSGSSSGAIGKLIYLKDLAGGAPYKLVVTDVKKGNDNTATVTCDFDYVEGKLIIVFKLIFDEEKWWLDDVEIKDRPLEKGEASYIIIHHLMVGEKELEPGDHYDSIIGLIDEEVSAQPKSFEGFDYIATYPNTISTGTVLARTDSRYPLTLELYYRKLAAYTLTIYFLNEDNSISTSTADVKKGIGYIGDKVSLTDDDLQRTYDGYKLITTAISDTIKNITEIDLQDDSLNELKLYYKVEEKIEPDPEEPEYTISGVVTDKNNNNKPIPNAVIKFFIVDENAQKGYSELYYNDNSNEQVQITTDSEGKYDTSKIENAEFKEGTYLLVVEVRGYESQTIKVKLPKESKENNFRANISL